MIRRQCAVLAISAILFAGCARDEGGNNRDTMTQRQKDSVLGQSGLPGAQGVTKALRASDSVKAHQAQVDSASSP
jgi:uncharacterized protein YdeI (BOF family)